MDMKEQDIKELTNAIKDLIWLNGLMATELIRIAENTAGILRGDDALGACGPQHAKLNEIAIGILEKHTPDKIDMLKEHVLGHE